VTDLSGSLDIQASQIALIRGINVGGHKKVTMADLRALLERLGFADVRSLLQSGNLVFRGGRRPALEVERLLEAECAKRLALDAHFFVRSANEWKTVVAENPFPKEAERDPGHLVVMCLKEQPGKADVKALQSAITGREVIRAADRHLYIVFPDGIGTSRLTNTLIEKRLGTRGTARNWNTVLKLDALVN
jgi:uncharacterized protein (DUF1697 family)